MSLCCRRLAEMLMDYLDGTLTPEEQAEAERHLAACPPCVIYLKTYRLTVQISHRLPAREPPREFFCRAMETARRAARGSE